ncbi:hypothetical protein VNO77_18437 [Canavalia gladiata]|uniref:Uncharacterized protein n=1 Tax=Canavalia gladiata TaxID=3824 RepID=A0AAN9QHP0_CANGL
MQLCSHQSLHGESKSVAWQNTSHIKPFTYGWENLQWYSKKRLSTFIHGSMSPFAADNNSEFSRLHLSNGSPLSHGLEFCQLVSREAPQYLGRSRLNCVAISLRPNKEAIPTALDLYARNHFIEIGKTTMTIVVSIMLTTYISE